MKKTLTRIFCLVLAIALMVPTFTSCFGSEDTTIDIGISGPLTGAAAVYGTAVYNSAKLAVDEINAAGGLDGVKFSLEMYDDKNNPELVSSGYAYLMEKGMQISLGTVTTKPALEFKDLAKDDNVFVLTPSATGDAVPEYDNAFQMCFADSNQGTASANYFNEEYVGKKVGVFYKSDDEYSTGILAKFESTLAASFGSIAKASFKEGDVDFSQQVQALKDCDVIFMPIYYTPASQFMTAGKDVIKANAIYYGCDGLDGIDAIENFDINAIPQEVSYLSHFDSNATEGAAADYIKKYTQAYGRETLNQFGAAAYDCIYAIYEALKAAKAEGKEINATTSASELCNILKAKFAGDFVFHGVTGKPVANGKSDISWTADGFVNKEAVKYIVKEAN